MTAVIGGVIDLFAHPKMKPNVTEALQRNAPRGLR
jgi:hypothetical protein